MNKFIKLVLVIISSILVIDNVSAKEYKGIINHAEYIDGVYYYKTRSDTDTVTYPTHNFHDEAFIYRESVTNKLVYCIQSWTPINGAKNGDYSVYDENVEESNLTDEELEYINLIAYFGYGYKDSLYDHTDYIWYAITQVLIWQVQAPNYNHYLVDSITSTTPLDYSKEFNEIKNLINLYNNGFYIPTSNDLIINNTISFEDSNSILNDYIIENNNKGLDVSYSNNKLDIKSLNETGSFNIRLYRDYNRWDTDLKLYISDNYQNTFTPGNIKSSNITSTINVKYSNIGIAYIGYFFTEYNYNYVSRKLSGIEANIIAKKDILDGNNNIIYKEGDIYTSITSINDYIYLDMLPGEYEIVELNRIDGFNIKNMSFTVTDEDKLIDIVLDNTKFNISVQKYCEVVNDGIIDYEVGSNIMFGLYANEDIYNVDGDIFANKDILIGIFITDDNGYSELNNLYLALGSYYIQELSLLDNYILNDNKYVFDVTYGSDYQSIIYIDTIEVINKLNRGNVNIEVKDSNGEPLNDIKFGIYNSNNELIETYVTDSNGSVSIDLVYGNYILKQLDELDGYIIDNNDYYINIDALNDNMSFNIVNDNIDIVEEETIEGDDISVFVPSTSRDDYSILLFILLILTLIFNIKCIRE
jgi:hypothetical protein